MSRAYYLVLLEEDQPRTRRRAEPAPQQHAPDFGEEPTGLQK
jgi:hypothetical protein